MNDRVQGIILITAGVWFIVMRQIGAKIIMRTNLAIFKTTLPKKTYEIMYIVAGVFAIIYGLLLVLGLIKLIK